MEDLALDVSGAQINGASCYDPRYAPENILDGDEKTMWTTTGSFPQEFSVQLSQPGVVSSIRTWTTNVKEMLVERCSGPSPTKWETFTTCDLEENEGGLQVQSSSVNRSSASFIKFKILSGYKDFVTVHRVSVEGRPKN